MESLKNKKIVVTGGAGFIGSHLVDALIARGDEVIVIDNITTGRKENLAHCAEEIIFYEKNITDFEFLKKAFEGVDVVYHQAALASVPKSIALPMETNEANIEGTLAVLTAARDAGVRRVVQAISSSVYGDSPTLPKHEDMPYNPRSPYALQKMTCEVYGKLFYKLYGLETVGLRYFNIFGPRQDPHSHYSAVIPKFINKIKKGERPVINGDGEHTRDFTYVSNAVDANIQAGHAKGAEGEVFNVASGGQISLNTLVHDINTILGTHIEPEYGEERVGDIRNSYADILKAKEILQYEPRVSFEEGLKRTIESL